MSDIFETFSAITRSQAHITSSPLEGYDIRSVVSKYGLDGKFHLCNGSHAAFEKKVVGAPKRAQNTPTLECLSYLQGSHRGKPNRSVILGRGPDKHILKSARFSKVDLEGCPSRASVFLTVTLKIAQI